MRSGIIVFAAALLLLGSGCQYANARLRDAADCIAASVSVGPGFIVEVQATWLAHAGIGMAEEDRFSFYYGVPLRSRTQSGVFGFPPVMSLAGDDHSMVMSALLMPLTMTSGDHLVVANPLKSSSSSDRLYERYTYSDIGARVHLGYFGFEFRVRLGEIIDFVLGLVTIDIPGDDVRTYGPPPEEQEPDEERPEEQQPFSVPQ